MDKTEKLKHIILSKYNSVREFSKIVEIPSTTLTSALDKGIGGMAVDRIIKICDVLNIDIKTFEPLEIVPPNNNLPQEETTLLENFNKLNELGKSEANKRIKELTFINDYTMEENKVVELPKKDDEFTKILEARKKAEEQFKGKEHLMPIASHDRDGEFTDEEYNHDDDLMDDEDFWK